MAFPVYKQIDSRDCAPGCLKIISKYFGKNINIQLLRELSETTRVGSNMQGLANAAESIGIRTLPAKINYSQLDKIPLPSIIHWNKNHFVVLYKVKGDTCFVSDPAHGLLSYPKKQFLSHWIGNNSDETTVEGVALLLEPTPKFYENEFDHRKNKLNLE